MKIPQLPRQNSELRLRKRLNYALSQLTDVSPESDDGLTSLVELVAILRPRHANDIDDARLRLRTLTECVSHDERLRKALRQALIGHLAQRNALRLFTDSGVLSPEPFLGGLSRRLGQRLLPEELDRTQMRDALRLLFPRESDHFWVAGVGAEAWIALLDRLRFQADDHLAVTARMNLQMMEALQVLSYRIAAIGLDPELVRINPAIERYESPFVMQNVELRDFLEERKNALRDRREPSIDDRHLMVLLDQCEKLMLRLRRQIADTGASVGLTTLLRRLEQKLARQRTLLRLIEPMPAHALNVERVKLFTDLVKAENQRYSIRHWLTQVGDILATRITQNASKSGELYSCASRGESLRLLRSASGAGLIVAGVAAVMLELSQTPRAPFGEAFVFSLNYALGFALMYLLHFSLATKQPAMTASTIARSLEGVPRAQQAETLSELMVCTFRSQLIAVVGNLLVAIPTALGLAMLSAWRHGAHIVDAAQAERLIQACNPLAPSVWVGAALTGVWLFAASLVSGYYDNKAVYDRLPRRIQQIAPLRRLLGPGRTAALAAYLEDHFGGLAGCLALGLMLGSTAAVGRILGLDLQAAQVSFSAAYAAFAFVALDLPPLLPLIALLATGVGVIGVVNLAVSFGLTLWVATRAQRVQHIDFGGLRRALWRRLRRTPSHFLWPPREPPPPPAEPTSRKRQNAGRSGEPADNPVAPPAPGHKAPATPDRRA